MRTPNIGYPIQWLSAVSSQYSLIILNPRLQFWQIDDAYFENPEIINTFVRLPMEWRIRPSQKSERHFGGEQREFFK